MKPVYRFESASVLVSKQFSDDAGQPYVVLSTLSSEVRGKGHASGLLRLVFQEADAEGVDLLLRPGVFSIKIGETLTRDQLTAWYLRYGFEPDPEAPHPWLRRRCQAAVEIGSNIGL